MQILHRHLSVVLHRAMQGEGAVALTGPRGAGLQTLAKSEFPRHTWVDLAQTLHRERARTDPETFLRRLRGPAIFDEAHRAPELLKALKTAERNHLALAPLRLDFPQELHLGRPSLAEREGRPLVDALALGHAAAHRAAPKLTLAKALESSEPNERQLEADLQTLVRPHDLDRVLRLLHRLTKLNGAIVDQSALAREASVTHTTVARWLETLERLFVLTLIPALDEDFGQRTVRRKKLFFLDHAWLKEDQRFPSFAIAELMKAAWHRGEPPKLAHWKTMTAEADVIVDRTLALSFSHLPILPPSLEKWKALAPRHQAALVITGRTTGPRPAIPIQPWFAL